MKTIQFLVPIGLSLKGEPQLYLAATEDYQTTSLKDEAASFVVRTTTTPVDDLRIEALEHDIAGGLEKYLDLQVGQENTYASLRARLERELWPEGRPVNPDLADECEELLGEAYNADDSSAKRGLLMIHSMVDRIAFLAAWPSIIVECPDGWRELHTKAIPRNTLGWVRNAYATAIAEHIEGKTQPSA